MTVFPTFFYTSAREIPTRFIYLHPEKGPRLGRASPYSPFYEEAPPLPPRDVKLTGVNRDQTSFFRNY